MPPAPVAPAPRAPAAPTLTVAQPKPSPPVASAPQPTPLTAAAPASPPRPDRVAALLAYYERVRLMSATELAREAARLDPAVTPQAALELAIVYGQTHNPGDLTRALAVLEPITRSADPALAPWQPFARWLAARYAEQRRVEDQLERQNALLRDQQRRIEQLNEKLEALKAIERSLLDPRPASRVPGSPSRGSRR